MTSIASSAARGAAATLVGQWLRFVIQLVALAVLARLLDADDYGLLGMILALVGVATLLGDFGLSAASIQVQDATARQRSNLLWLNLLAGTVLSLVVYFCAEPIAAFYGEPELAQMTRVLSIVFFLNAAAAQFRAEVSRSFRFIWLAVSDVLGQAIAAAVAIVLALGGATYWALIAQQITVASVTLVVLIIGARWLPNLPNRSSVRPFLTFGVNTTLVQLVNYASSNVDSVLIGRVVGADALGFYDRAYQIFRMPLMQIAAPMTRVALPVLSKLQNTDRYEPFVQRAQLLLTYSMGGAFLLAAGMADPIIDIILGPDWGPSKVLFQVLALGGVFQALAFSYHWVFMSKGMTGLQLRYSVGTRLLMIGLMCVGIIWGAFGVAIGSSIGLAVNWLILTVFAIPKTGVSSKALVRISLRPIIVFAIIGVSLVLTTRLATIQAPLLLLGLLIAQALALLALAFLVPQVRRDAGAIRDTVARLRRR